MLNSAKNLSSLNSWTPFIKGFVNYLKLERQLSSNTIENYLRDVEKLSWFDLEQLKKGPKKLSYDDFQHFLAFLNELGLSSTSQNRILSGIKQFYGFLLLEKEIEENPTELLESAKTQRKFPDVLSNDEVEFLLASIDLSHPQGQRNKTIIEVLYGCGLRVSELVNLNITDIHFEEGFIIVTGKGNKQRLVPLGSQAIKHLKIYINEHRVHQEINYGHENIVFLNRRGKQLTRVMIFTMLKKQTELAGIKKNISPHTLRHSFATELVQRGADLRAVQDMLGHSSITTTEIYAHMNKQTLLDSIIQFHPRS